MPSHSCCCACVGIDDSDSEIDRDEFAKRSRGMILKSFIAIKEKLDVRL